MRLIFLALILLFAGCISQAPEAPPNETVKPTEPPNTTALLANGTYSIQAYGVTYHGNTKGYLARPDDTGEYPGIVMIHEWWGLNKNIRDMAEKLASQGYVVIAVDLHGGQVATTPEEARNLVSLIDQQEANSNMRAAATYLRDNEGSNKIGSLGWCFGGGQSMQLALSGEGMDATVIYYGNPVTNETRLQVITWPVLGIFGGEDTSIPVTRVREFESAMDSLGIENEIYIYPGVGHAFANPSGANYAPNETMDAWDKTTAFLDSHLK